MTTTRQLYSLQELDLALDLIDSQKSEAEQELGSRPRIEDMEATLQRERGQLEEAQRLYRLQQLEAETMRERSARLDNQLYSGEITSPRELETIQQEASNARQQLERREGELLELSLRMEESQTRCADLERELAETQEAWRNRQEELTVRLQQLAQEREGLKQQRTNLAATVDSTALQRYEALRRTKGGHAVAKVERGLCQACRMSLPTQQLQRVRSGRQTVLCSSCGRMLLLT